jgi:hypothetical protein
LGISGLYFEIKIIYPVIVSGHIDQLIFSTVKHDAGMITNGYPALIQHLVMLFGSCLLIALAVNEMMKIFHKTDSKITKKP